jgi:hypothetical protein
LVDTFESDRPFTTSGQFSLFRQFSRPIIARITSGSLAFSFLIGTNLYIFRHFDCLATLEQPEVLVWLFLKQLISCWFAPTKVAVHHFAI